MMITATVEETEARKHLLFSGVKSVFYTFNEIKRL